MDYEKVYEEIVQNLREYVINNNLKSLVLGISGGIDSTVCAAIINEVAKRTPGLDIYGLSMPSFKNKLNEVNAADTVGEGWFEDPGLEYRGEYLEVPISDIYYEFQVRIFKTIPTQISDLFPDGDMGMDEWMMQEKIQTPIANGNIMARIRMILLYNWAGVHKGIVIDTDNLTEHYLGFFTIHGDQGDYKPIGNLWKMEVYGLAQWILENKCNTEAKADSLTQSIALVPTDGNGVSKSDLEQIGGDSYDQVDRVLRNEILKENNDLSDIPDSVQKQILGRYHSSWFKRV